MDSINNWCLAKVVEVSDKHVKVHYDGWSQKWDFVSFFHNLGIQSDHKQNSAFQKAHGRIHWLEQISIEKRD
jgi:hypothetical protein